MGLSITYEPNDGTCVGAMTNPSSMSAQNQSRSDSRTGYLDPVINRPNLHIATEQTVTRILLETVNQLQKAVGVEVCGSGIIRVRSSLDKEKAANMIHQPVCAFG